MIGCTFREQLSIPLKLRRTKKPSPEYTEPIKNFHVRILDLVEVKAS